MKYYEAAIILLIGGAGCVSMHIYEPTPFENFINLGATITGWVAIVTSIPFFIWGYKASKVIEHQKMIDELLEAVEKKQNVNLDADGR